MANYGLFPYFTRFMETLSKATSTFASTLGEAIQSTDTWVGQFLDWLNIDVSSIPVGLLDITLAQYLFGGALIGVLIWSIVKWIVPLI